MRLRRSWGAARTRRRPGCGAKDGRRSVLLGTAVGAALGRSVEALVLCDDEGAVADNVETLAHVTWRGGERQRRLGVGGRCAGDAPEMRRRCAGDAREMRGRRREPRGEVCTLAYDDVAGGEGDAHEGGSQGGDLGGGEVEDESGRGREGRIRSEEAGDG